MHSARRAKTKKFKQYSLLAGTGGFFDSFAGGGWGPIVTSTLINTGRSHKYAVGTVSLTEFFVTLASAFTFFTLIGVSHWQTIVALIIGGDLLRHRSLLNWRENFLRKHHSYYSER
ncbi:MAG: sulfite exporter TauE/SafE family protein [Bacteroidota bacterium]